MELVLPRHTGSAPAGGLVIGGGGGGCVVNRLYCERSCDRSSAKLTSSDGPMEDFGSGAMEQLARAIAGRERERERERDESGGKDGWASKERGVVSREGTRRERAPHYGEKNRGDFMSRHGHTGGKSEDKWF